VCQRLIDRQMEEVERNRKRAASEKKKDSRGDKVSSQSRSATGRALSASDFASSRNSNFAHAPVRASKRIPKKDKTKVVYPMGGTRPAGNIFFVTPGSCRRDWICLVKEQSALMLCGAASLRPPLSFHARFGSFPHIFARSLRSRHEHTVETERQRSEAL
jgi:hypothetical protein